MTEPPFQFDVTIKNIFCYHTCFI